MNPTELRRTGNKTLAIVITELVKRDYKILLPFMDNERYDFVIDHNGILSRIQCKTGWLKDGSIYFRTCAINLKKGKWTTNCYDGEIDMFAVYSPDLDKVYMIPFDKVKAKTMMLLRVEDTKQNRTLNINWAKDYELN